MIPVGKGKQKNRKSAHFTPTNDCFSLVGTRVVVCPKALNGRAVGGGWVARRTDLPCKTIDIAAQSNLNCRAKLIKLPRKIN